MIGGCRGAGDEARVAELRGLVADLGLTEWVSFEVNLPFPDMLKYLGRARAGIHTMWNEHFGIGVVEYMASGCITIAHNSVRRSLVLLLSRALHTLFFRAVPKATSSFLTTACRQGILLQRETSMRPRSQR
jgi:alpha-1,2-mannosyltransferase